MVAHRKAIESLYSDKCTIYSWENSKDVETRITKPQRVKKYEGVPCRLSFKNISSVNQTTFEAVITQVIKLFISKDISIKEGSEIEIERDGQVNLYKCSGMAARYSNHQEIILINAKERA